MKNVIEILRASGFRFNKALGQNFIFDGNLLDAIASDAGLEAGDTVVEIGAGAGTLTEKLAARAERVFAFEVDAGLRPVLDTTLRGLENVEVEFADVLKISDEELASIVGGRPFKVVANLPYYITTPVIMRFLESGLDVRGLTVMVQREVADRICASPGTSDYAALTLAVAMRGDAVVTRKVPRQMFVPMPGVDSAVVRIDPDPERLKGEDVRLLRRLVRGAFAMRRKTLSNNLSAAFSLPKAEIDKRIVAAGLSPTARGETLSLDDYVRLSKQFKFSDK